MNKQEYLLTCLAEEASEISHAVAKALRFGLEDVSPDTGMTNRDQIIKEFHDLFAVFEMLELLEQLDYNMLNEKQEKVEYWMEYSKSKGCLEEEIE